MICGCFSGDNKLVKKAPRVETKEKKEKVELQVEQESVFYQDEYEISMGASTVNY